jgi:hypothetical protein
MNTFARLLHLAGALLLLIGAHGAQAMLVAQDSRFGARTVIHDTATDLRWLRLDLTFNTAYLDVLDNMQAGERFAGFQVAGINDVTGLIRGQGGMDWQSAGTATLATFGEAFTALRFATLFGGIELGPHGPSAFLSGNVDMPMYGCGFGSYCDGSIPRYVSTSVDGWGHLSYQDDAFSYEHAGAQPRHGTWLLATPVPEPGTLLLLLSGIGATLFFVRRRTGSDSRR